MTDNIDEEHLDNPIKNKLENPPDENGSTTDTERIISNQITENMEVHHHPDLHHKPKKWKEYFLEFLMIFLAVTMGFFAENIREHFIEKKKEKQVIISLQKDLMKDTTTLNKLINIYIPTHNAWVDSFNYYIDSLPLKGNERKISMGLQNATFWSLYQPPEISLYLLKNLGSFSLIENEKVKAEILDYNGLLNNYIKYSEFIASVQHSVDTAAAALITRNDVKTFLDKALAHIRLGEIGFIDIDDAPSMVKFKTYNKDKFVKFIAKLDQVTSKLSDMNFQYQFILEREIKLLKVIKEEYPNF